MYQPDHTFRTIKEAYVDLLKIILDEGEEVENLLEINNISVVIEHPLLNHIDLFENVTPIAAKHMDQMLLKPNPDLPKTHYERLHNYVVPDDDYGNNTEQLASDARSPKVFPRKFVITCDAHP